MGIQKNNSSLPEEDFFAIKEELEQNKALVYELYIKNERYRMIMENASCAIFLGKPEGILIDVNAQAAILLGREKENIIGKNYLTFLPPQDRDLAINRQHALIESHKRLHIPMRVERPTGEYRSTETSLDIIKTNGEEIVLAITNDITEKNKLKAQAFLNDRLSNLGILTAGITHEMNSPLAWLASNLKFIENNLKKMEIKTDQKELYNDLCSAINDSMEGTKRLQEIVADLRGFANIKDKRAFVVNVTTIIDTILNMISDDLKANAKLTKHFCPELPNIKTDKGKLYQLLLNLIRNAFQSIKQGDKENNEITITTKNLSDQICIEIKDTGLGISKQALPHIFEPFFTTKPSEEGLGLGLSICHDIIQKLQGKIEVESVEGKGTQFTIYLPLELCLLPKN